MFIQLILHWLGDYVLQSDWMALNKTKKSLPCFIHCYLYSIPFLVYITFWLPSYGHWINLWAYLFILGTHYIIDRYSLAKYIVWLKNHLNPDLRYQDFKYCKITGYYDRSLEGGFGLPSQQAEGIRPYFLTMWLYIIVDNGLHIICNYIAIKYL